MMDQQHAERLFGRKFRQQSLQRLELRAPEPPVAINGRRRHRRRHADQRQRPAPAQQRKAGVAPAASSPREIVAPSFGKMMAGAANIGVVIAGNHGDPIGRADALEPCPRRREFRLQRQIDEIAGDRDMVRPLRLHVGYQRVEHVAALILWRLRVQFR